MGFLGHFSETRAYCDSTKGSCFAEVKACLRKTGAGAVGGGWGEVLFVGQVVGRRVSVEGSTLLDTGGAGDDAVGAAVHWSRQRTQRALLVLALGAFKV